MNDQETLKRKRLTRIITAVLTLCLLVTPYSALAESIPAQDMAGQNIVLDEDALDGPPPQLLNDPDLANIEPGDLDGTFTAKDILWAKEDEYVFPNLGLKFKLDKKILKGIDKQDYALIDDMAFDDHADGAIEYKYVMMTFSKMTQKQAQEEIQKIGMGFQDWLKSLDRFATLGLFKASLTDKELNEITGLKDHKELATTQDGQYRYILSTDSKNHKKEAKLMAKTEFDIEPIEALRADCDPWAKVARSFEETGMIAPLTCKTLDGKDFTEKDFAKAKLTLVNIMGTGCTACVKEMPDLEKFYQEMKDKGVQVITVVADLAEGAADDKAQADLYKKAKRIQEKTGVTYPMLIPDANRLYGLLDDIIAFPVTFFVDQEGQVVSDEYSGSKTLAEWKEIAEKVLADVPSEEK